MKRLSLFIIALFMCIVSFAQNADFAKAVSKFKTAKTVKAVAVRVDHKAAVANDEKLTGTLTIASPDKMNICVAEGKEQLDMNGQDFTMVMRGREHKTNSSKNSQFVAFQAVLTAIINGDPARLNNVGGIEMKKSGDILTISMDPSYGMAKKKRMMFSSFVITLDCKKGEIKTLRMNGRGSNYTEYSFSNFVFK
ncbi:MAG: outer membrane lipoprotein carrier protein LolA [Bacteroidaceae bacterium]|nr:outer membrane lipoprotein carrier protein LolA [Bacteroidaceae bacterium]